jgi:hypothetical protein
MHSHRIDTEIQKLQSLFAADESSLRRIQSNPWTGQSRAEHKSLQWALAFRRRQLALAKYELLFQRKFDPNQPRVPAGNSAGGQWTSGGGPESGQWTSGGATTGEGTFDGEQQVASDASGSEPWSSYTDAYRDDGSLASQFIEMRDGSIIRSQFASHGDEVAWDARHTVVTPDESIRTFENSGHAQTIYDDDAQLISKAVWTDDGPDLQTLAQPAYYGPAAPIIVQGGRLIVQKTVEAALALYTWMSARSGPGQQTVIAAKASDYTIEGGSKNPQAVWVGTLAADDMRGVCDKLKTVQDFMNKAVDDVRKENAYKGPADFGTKVHKIIAARINALGEENFVAEYSLLKSMEAAPDGEKPPRLDGNDYGLLGTIRIDALENRPDIATVCIYDPKSGLKPLTAPRMLELAQTAAKRFPNSRRMIVTEVRDSRL